MSNDWAKSLSYRDSLDALTDRFTQLKMQDRLITSDQVPCIETIDGYFFAINSAPAKISPTEWLGDLLPLVQLPDEKPSEAVNTLISYQLHCHARMAQQK